MSGVPDHERQPPPHRGDHCSLSPPQSAWLPESEAPGGGPAICVRASPPGNAPVRTHLRTVLTRSEETLVNRELSVELVSV